FLFFSSRRRHTRFSRDWSSDVCSSDLPWLTDALSFCGVTGGTYPCLRPRKRIDYIFCSSHFRILEASVVSVEDCPSDHLPVRCLLDWSKDEAGSGIMGTNRRAERDGGGRSRSRLSG